ELQDYQLFVEQNGEEKIGCFSDSFINDSRFVAFIPWIKEKRRARERHKVTIGPEIIDVASEYKRYLMELLGSNTLIEKSETEFDIAVLEQGNERPEIITAEFYVEDDQHYVILTREKVIFDGPCVIPKALEDIIVPARCENLQPPSPSNPLGADHIIMVDWPSWDEIHRLAKSGYYDLLRDEDFENLEKRAESGTGDHATDVMGPEPQKALQDSLAGSHYGNAKTASKTLTRLTYFGKWKLGDDEFEEEIVARVLIGPDNNVQALCRLRYLEEEYPRQDLSRPRPFACSPAFIPIPGQWIGFSLLDLLEHMHDLTKILLDQMVDKQTLSSIPWFLYRSASGVRPEVIRMAPGEGYPVSNPQTDFHFPQIPQGDQSTGMNLIALIQQWAERQSMQGGLQFGGVPQGKSSALRTSTNMMAVLQQGDARPERILRRFFKGIAEIYQQMHELNKVFLPANKQYRVTGITAAGADPYRIIQDPHEIGGMFQFDFKANALNTNKAITSQILQEMLPVIINPFTMQMGLTDPEHIFNLLKDYIQSKGQDDHKYIKAPINANIPKITAQDAMGQMVQGILPQGMPAEGAQQHLQTLSMFQQDPRYNELVMTDPSFQAIFQTYTSQVQQLAMQEQQQAQLAQQFAQSMGGGGGTGGPEGHVDPMAGEMSMQGPGQVNDESLPGAKGQMV
ncbi:MAG: portal protein, partial [Eubacterium aggregans]